MSEKAAAAPAAGAPSQEKGVKKAKKGKKGASFEERAAPDYIAHRCKVWDEVRARRQQDTPAIEAKPIKITLPDGKVIDGTAGTTTCLDVAKGISQKLGKEAIAGVVDDVAYDLLRPLEKDCRVEILTFDSEKGEHVFWHSSAHILGEALEYRYGCKLCIGPPVEGGFYYDADTGEAKVTEDDYAELEHLVKKVVAEKQQFERLVLKKEEALEMFKYNEYKKSIVASKVPDGETCTAYRCGTLIDLCRGPHLPNTGYVKAFKVMKNSSSYWLGKAENAPLQRVYGVAFPSEKRMKEHVALLAEAAKRDHRKLGVEQELFFFHPYSPGTAFWQPHGTRIFNGLVKFMQNEYRERGFTEVISPNMFNCNLWETSGHWQHYKDDMFTFQVEKQDFALKPMNCPGHCLMYKNTVRSYRDLPMRYAEFGVLHRNELSGALSGLTRVRRFQQDDAHIFCRPDQVKQEISNALGFLTHVYGIFGFEFSLELSTRPEKYIGSLDVWNSAEEQLQQALEASGRAWKLNPGDGAFYGPKIDIHVRDSLRRAYQCATIQLDFTLPERFDLSYMGEDTTADAAVMRPVMIHRAIYGSLERFIAILTEHTGGKWPFWISPRQICVVTVSDKFDAYAKQVGKRLHDAGYYVDVDDSNKTMQYRVRAAQKLSYNFILVVGEEEQNNGTVNVRPRDTAAGADNVRQSGIMTVDAAVEMFNELKAQFK